MANRHEAIEGWEWDSVFLSPDRSFLEPETSIDNWQDHFSESASTQARIHTLAGGADLSSASGLCDETVHFTIGATTVSEQEPPVRIASCGNPVCSESDRQTGVSDCNNRLECSVGNSSAPPEKKKRDPRLDCPNFLAGRVPCSCPEIDEAEDCEIEDTGKRRPKAAARCQVPSCGGDISHLKGYHQRHRVCLGCANSPKVILKDQPHRYCQQCGKFHRLSDFDEGKRSCRRKLERHNKRRRRRPSEAGGEVEERASSALASEKDHLDAGSSSADGQNTPSANLQMYDLLSCQQPAENPVGQSREENFQVQSGCPQNGGGLAGGFGKALGNNGNNGSAEECHASDASSTIVIQQQMLRSNKSGLDEQSWLAMLMGDTGEGIGFPSSSKCASQTRPSKPELQRSSPLSNGHKKHSGYTSPCPTGRVSFKLYDWNPADFPRRLRQQIFEWLANMPVELEGYIRSGCIILTFFVTMSLSDWDKIMDDWIGQAQNIVLGPGHKLWGTGQILACLNDKNVLIKNGVILRTYFKENLAPTLVDVYPLALEAGCAMEIYISGFNLDTEKSRFFLSFGEQCLECKGCKPVEDHYNTQGTVGRDEHGLEIMKVMVSLPDCKKFGPAYIEVDNDHGISNAIPLLVADKGVCAEVNSLGLKPEFLKINHEAQAGTLETCRRDLLGQQCFADLLTDFGWVFRHTEKCSSVLSAQARTMFIRRFERLLLFSARHGWCRVAERLLYTAMETGLITELGMGSDGPRSQHVINMNTMKDFKDSTNIHMSDNLSLLECFFNDIKVQQGYPSPSEVSVGKGDGDNGSHLQHHCKGSGETECRSAVNVEPFYLPSLDSEHTCSANWISAQVYKQSFMEAPLLEKRIPIIEDTPQQKKSPFGWLKRSARNLGSMHIYSTDRKFRQIVFTAVSVVMLCVGMCVVLQHPHQVAEISMSLRRCLWGFDHTLPVV